VTRRGCAAWPGAPAYTWWLRDLTVGMDGTDVRAGVIKVGSSLDRVTDPEARVILRLVEAGHGRLHDADAQALVVANPASFLTWRVG
jgi:predicted metal-dependent phosphotriesterase family hydrolase